MLLFSFSSNFKHNIQIHPNTQILTSFGIWITFGESSLDYQIAGQTDPRFWKSMSLSTAVGWPSQAQLVFQTPTGNRLFHLNQEDLENGGVMTVIPSEFENHHPSCLKMVI
jgi:hypothetical protein